MLQTPTTAGALQGINLNEVLRALLDAKDRLESKTGRNRLGNIIIRLFLSEEVPSEILAQLSPLLRAPSLFKDPRIVRSIFHLLETHLGRGTAGTPTLIDSLSPRKTDEKVQALILQEIWKLLQKHDLDPALKRASLCVVAAVARHNEPVRVELIGALQRAINAADALSTARTGTSKKGKKGPPGADTQWDLQHTSFLINRTSGSANGTDDLSRSCFVGVHSPDPVGARHALALAAEVAIRNPSQAVYELGTTVNDAAQHYETLTNDDTATLQHQKDVPSSPITISDPFARLHLARLCSAVVYSDQSAGDVSRDGGPFWKMLVLLAIRDNSDLVRFGALNALSGSVLHGPSIALQTTPVATHKSKQTSMSATTMREDVVLQQKRARAWRVLTAQAAMPIALPGARGSKDGTSETIPTMKLADAIGRLLLAALRKSESAARFCAAAGVVASLAESRLAAGAGTATSTANQYAGGAATRTVSSPELDKVLEVLAKEMSILLDGPIRASERCAALEALLLLSGAGISNPLTPAKVASAASGGGQWSSGMQDALLIALLKSAKSRPKEAGSYLGYASVIAGIRPSGLDVQRIFDLWEAAAASGGQEGKDNALVAAFETLGAAAPAAARYVGTDAVNRQEMLRAAAEENGWLAFQAASAWWLGEHANSLSQEFVGRQSALPDRPPLQGREKRLSAHAPPEEVLRKYAERNPGISKTINVLQDIAATASWQVRLAAVAALAKIAIRSGEPYRLRCYAVLNALVSGDGGTEDPMGVASSVLPALALMDKVYATQLCLDAVFKQFGDDPSTWPVDILSSLARQAKTLTRIAEEQICTLSKDRYAILGFRAVAVLAAAPEEDGGGDSYATFLTSEVDKEVSSVDDGRMSDRNLSKTKNKEVEDILSFGGSEEVSVAAWNNSEASAVLDQRNNSVIENMLAGRPADAIPGSDPWTGFSSAPTAISTNAFALEGLTGPASSPQSPIKQPAYEYDIAADPWGAMASERPASPKVPRSPSKHTTNAIGTGMVVHTFVADAAHAEELSVFEGDQVAILEESDGWMLVADPTGHQGLVPTSYIKIEQLTSAAKTAAAHGRNFSLDYSRSKEDFLDNIFSGVEASLQPMALPTMPEEEETSPASFPADFSAQGLSPVALGTPQQEAGVAGNPFSSSGQHQTNRTQSMSSHRHQRSVSGVSSEYGGGSIPGTPGKFEGRPEKKIVAGFVGEMEGELTVEPGDAVVFHSEIGGWATVMRVSDSKIGLVPTWAVGDVL